MTLPDWSAGWSQLRVLRGKFELIMIDNGSRDQSWSVIKKLAAKNGWVHGINLMRNYGQHNALLCGIREARYETILTPR
jgi:glycosyltransferase involved in cell wall biosynthesis